MTLSTYYNFSRDKISLNPAVPIFILIHNETYRHNLTGNEQLTKKQNN